MLFSVNARINDLIIQNCIDFKLKIKQLKKIQQNIMNLLS
jgi:hypothetical protein